MTLRFPKPTKCTRPQPKRIRRRHTIAFERAAVKAASPGVDPDTWQAIVEFYGGWCAYECGRRGSVRDHVKPLSRGGLDEPGNSVLACPTCNFAKGTQTWTVPRPHPWMKQTSSGADERADFPLKDADGRKAGVPAIGAHQCGEGVDRTGGSSARGYVRP